MSSSPNGRYIKMSWHGKWVWLFVHGWSTEDLWWKVSAAVYHLKTRDMTQVKYRNKDDKDQMWKKKTKESSGKKKGSNGEKEINAENKKSVAGPSIATGGGGKFNGSSGNGSGGVHSDSGKYNEVRVVGEGF